MARRVPAVLGLAVLSLTAFACGNEPSDVAGDGSSTTSAATELACDGSSRSNTAVDAQSYQYATAEEALQALLSSGMVSGLPTDGYSEVSSGGQTAQFLSQDAQTLVTLRSENGSWAAIAVDSCG